MPTSGYITEGAAPRVWVARYRVSLARISCATRGLALPRKRGNATYNVLLQKVGADGPGDFARGLLVDPEVVELREYPHVKSREDRRQPSHRFLRLRGVPFPARHEQDARGYLPIGGIGIVKASYLLMFA